MNKIFILIIVATLCGCASVQKRYADTSTSQLQLRRAQIAQYLEADSGRMECKFGPPMFMMMQGNPRADRIKEKEEIEQELLRRYQSGDKDAYLAVFGPAISSQSQ